MCVDVRRCRNQRSNNNSYDNLPNTFRGVGKYYSLKITLSDRYHHRYLTMGNTIWHNPDVENGNKALEDTLKSKEYDVATTKKGSEYNTFTFTSCIKPDIILDHEQEHNQDL